ncbi:YeiH family protein [Nonomuraea zeae]|uniref:YeiH family protein n=1 Tax=Nonomuraea zeae TaxID=1642303 RepID=UPI00197F8964|nr:putative sulfate exporter family transporter [Nonomuraea zeae]
MPLPHRPVTAPASTPTALAAPAARPRPVHGTRAGESPTRAGSGLPAAPGVAAATGEGSRRGPSLVPGVALAALAVVFALLVNRVVPALSPAVIAVLSGTALAASAGVGGRLRPGLAFVSRRVLRVAVALLGLQIAVPQVLALGWQTLAVVAVATGVTFTVTPRIGRLLGLTRGTSLLIATGVSICGAAAIAAMRESTDVSDDDDAAGALGVVVLYGTASIVLVPLLAALIGLSPTQLGVWAGAAVHEVAQVAAIGAASGVLAGAVTVKLGRVVLLAPIVALTSHRLRRLQDAAPRPGRTRRPPVMPLFVAAFLAMVIVRSTGQIPAAVTDAVPQVTNVLMAAALFGLGTGIDVRKLAKGGRAVLLGGIATGIVSTVSLAGVALLV